MTDQAPELKGFDWTNKTLAPITDAVFLTLDERMLGFVLACGGPTQGQTSCYGTTVESCGGPAGRLMRARTLAEAFDV